MADMTMSPIELAERLALLLARAFLFVAGGFLASGSGGKASGGRARSWRSPPPTRCS